MIIPQLITILINIVFLVLQSSKRSFINIIETTLVGDYIYFFKFTLWVEFVLSILQPFYYFLIETYEFAYSRQFHFGAFGASSMSLQYFYACLIIIAIFVPSVFNFITLRKLLYSYQQDLNVEQKFFQGDNFYQKTPSSLNEVGEDSLTKKTLDYKK